MGRPRAQLTKQQRGVLEALVAAAAAEEQAKAKKAALAQRASELGVPWREIGEVLGVTPQSAHERYSKRKGEQR